MRATGSSILRNDAIPKVTGAALYPGDIDLPNQAWIKIVFAGVPHARIRSVHVDAARVAPGVLKVLVAADVPVNEYGLIMFDQPVICGTGSTPQAELVRWEADCIAIVVAESMAEAEAAAKLVTMEYDPLPLVTDPLEALKPGAHPLHPYPFPFPYGERDPNSNVLLEYYLIDGDIAAGFEQADVIVEATYHTQAQEHAYLQPEAGSAHVLPDGRIEVICAGQWMHEEREQVAHALGLPDDQIVIRHATIGGAFGGREDISIQIALALAAMKVGRPVKTIWSREESIVAHHKRHPFILKAKWGATRDGRIVAAEMDVTSDAGGYAYTSTKVLGNALLASLGPYVIPNVHVTARTVYTNNTPSGAFRGFGGPQGHYAAEMQMNKIAAALGMDPVEVRMKNLWREGSLQATRSVVPPGCTAREVTETAARAAGWEIGETGVWHRSAELPQPARNRALMSLEASAGEVRRGIGIACCFKNIGYSLAAPESSNAWVELHGNGEIERVIVGNVGADVGQGAHSALRQIAASAIGIDVDRVELRCETSDIAGSSGSASASRLTFMAGNAIVGAAQRALAQWQDEERPARADFTYRPRATTGYDRVTGESDPNITHGYCAQVAEVEVDMETGHVTVTRLYSVNDVGRAVNPQQVEGQIEGGAAQSVGWSITEDYIVRDGHAITNRLSTYLIPSVYDVAEEIEPIILEIPDPQGPLGIRGMAELPMIPTAAAIGAAIHDATGVWIDEIPYKPEKVWQALNKR